jgi:hypothetical protein
MEISFLSKGMKLLSSNAGLKLVSKGPLRLDSEAH